jgi:hypothetical protein
MSVNSHKYRQAEQGGEQANDRAWNRDWHIKPTEPIEPWCFHTYWFVRDYGTHFAPQSESSQALFWICLTVTFRKSSPRICGQAAQMRNGESLGQKMPFW